MGTHTGAAYIAHPVTDRPSPICTVGSVHGGARIDTTMNALETVGADTFELNGRECIEGTEV